MPKKSKKAAVSNCPEIEEWVEDEEEHLGPDCMTKAVWLKTATDASKLCESQWGIPANITLAMAVLETGWGQHQTANNCFGIKSYPGCYGVQNLLTTEYRYGKSFSEYHPFATFPTVYDCFEKHAELLSTYPAWARYRLDHDFKAFVRDMAKEYATDPGYADKLMQLMSESPIKDITAK